MADVDVDVTGGGSIRDGVVRTAADVQARCSLCAATVAVSASIGDGRFACAECLRQRLDAMSVARFRLGEGRASGLPWGKVTG